MPTYMTPHFERLQAAMAWESIDLEPHSETRLAMSPRLDSTDGFAGVYVWRQDPFVESLRYLSKPATSS